MAEEEVPSKAPLIIGSILAALSATSFYAAERNAAMASRVRSTPARTIAEVIDELEKNPDASLDPPIAKIRGNIATPDGPLSIDGISEPTAYYREVVTGRSIAPLSWNKNYMRETRLSHNDRRPLSWAVTDSSQKFVDLTEAIELMDEDLVVKTRKEGHVGSPTISGALGFFGFHYSYVHAVEQKILPVGSRVTVMGPVVKGTRGLMIVNPSRANQILSPNPTPIFATSRSEEDWVHTVEDKVFNFRVAGVALGLPGAALVAYALNFFHWRYTPKS